MKMKRRVRKNSLAMRLYEAARRLSDSCGDNFGTESADNGEYERFYDENAKEGLDRILAEFEQKERLK